MLKLTLHATSYDWEFVPIAGQSFTDIGSAACSSGLNPTATASPTPTMLPPSQTQQTFMPVADTYVDQASPSSAFATNSEIKVVGGTSPKYAFLRFTVSGLIAGQPITSARLRLFVTNDSTSGGSVRALTNTTWPETMIWDSQPAIDGPQLAALGAVALNQFVEIDLTSAITGNGDYSFAITLPASNTNTLGYASRENSTAANRPLLIITT